MESVITKLLEKQAMYGDSKKPFIYMGIISVVVIGIGVLFYLKFAKRKKVVVEDD
uniref:Uncharacterized protein n=1 Tax=viral metagenome TaxID=1070528 RepID=A0A6C0J7U7_9ZZZZ